jgi:hypothetical protein
MVSELIAIDRRAEQAKQAMQAAADTYDLSR